MFKILTLRMFRSSSFTPQYYEKVDPSSEHTTSPPHPARRLFSIIPVLLCCIVFMTIGFFTTYLSAPSKLPISSLKWLAKAKGEQFQIYTTGPEFCSPLIEEEKLRRYTNSMKGLIFKKLSGTTWLPREDWAYVISGEELMSRGEYSVHQHGKDKGMTKLIHQSWKSNIVPERFREWSDSWRALHPGWEQVIWSDSDNLALVSDYYPEWLDLYKALETPIHKADLARNLYMHKVRLHFNFVVDSFIYFFFLFLLFLTRF